MNLRPAITAFLFFACCIFVHGQELNGIWKGNITQLPGGCFPVYNVELQVNINKENVNGYCYHYSDVTNYVKKNYH